MHVCGSACALAFLSHMWGMCCLCWAGEEELETAAQRRDSDEQAGSRQAGRLGCLSPHPRAAQAGAVVLGLGLYMLPQCP